MAWAEFRYAWSILGGEKISKGAGSKTIGDKRRRGI